MAIPTALTNRLRTLLDHYVPRRIRDSRWFMFPFFWVWFKRKNVDIAMDIKRLAPQMTAAEFRGVYQTVDNLGSGRETDTNPDALRYALDQLDADSRSLIDIGCGRGYVLRTLQQDGRFERLRLAGCDVLDRSDVGRADYIIGDLEGLPFQDTAFDIVLCFHTLEHTRDLAAAVAEVRRICRRQLIVIVPRQDRFYYTLDLHLQFFPTCDSLAMALGIAPEHVRQFGSDLVAEIRGSALR